MPILFEGELREPAEFDGRAQEPPAFEGELREPAEFEGRARE